MSTLLGLLKYRLLNGIKNGFILKFSLLGNGKKIKYKSLNNRGIAKRKNKRLF